MAQVLREVPSETFIVLDEEETEILYELLYSWVGADILHNLRDELAKVRGTMHIGKHKIYSNSSGGLGLKKIPLDKP